MNRRLWTWLLVPCLAIGVPACEMDVDDEPDIVAPGANGDEPDTNIFEGPEIEAPDAPDLDVQEGPDVDLRESPDVNVQEAPDLDVQDAPDASGDSGGGARRP